MKLAQTQLEVLAILATAAGCSQGGFFPPDAEPPRVDLSMAVDLARPDSTTLDLSVKRGWTKVEVPDTSWLNAVWGSGPGDVYAVGLGGVILHSTGDDVWTPQKTGRPYDLHSVFGSSATDVYAVENEAVLHSQGDGHWSVVANLVPQGTGVLRQIWMSSSTNIYVAGSTFMSVPAYPTGGVNIMKWNAPNVSREYAMARHNIASFHGTHSTDLWAVGSYSPSGSPLGMILHSTGDGVWTKQTFQPDLGTLYQGNLTAVWSSSKTDVYVGAGTGIDGSWGVFRSSGAGMPWRRETDEKERPNINGLWGSGPTDVWAVGLKSTGSSYSCLILRSKGDGRWAPDPDLTAADASQHPCAAIWGSRFGDVYVTGHGGLILHKRE